MENLETRAMKAIEINKSELTVIRQYLKTDRYSEGKQALHRWYRVGSIYNALKLSNAFSRREIVAAFDALMGIEISKHDRTAASKLAGYEYSAVYKWYRETERFMVSPRTIFKAYGDSLKPAKTDETPDKDETPDDKTTKTAFQKITENLTAARKLIESGIADQTLTPDDLQQIKLFAMGIEGLTV